MVDDLKLKTSPVVRLEGFNERFVDS